MIRPILKYIFLTVVTVFSLAACGGTGTEGRERDNPAIRPAERAAAYSDLFLDSMAIEQFIAAHNIGQQKAGQLRDFYTSRGYQYAWFAEDGLDEHGKAFWNLHNNFLNYSQDSSFFNKQLHQTMEALLNEEDTDLNSQAVLETELALTEHFFDYAQFAFAGKVDPAELKWYIPQKKVNPVTLLDSLIARNGQQLDEWEPLGQPYKALRRELLRYYTIEKNGGWPAIKEDRKVYKTGDSAAVIKTLKERLRISGDLAGDDTTAVFTAALKKAVQLAQKRFGLQQDGVAGPATLRALNIPVAKRIEQMLVNMERMRWMPPAQEGRRMVANIPEFKLHVYEGDEEVMSMRIVVGKAANRTVIFNDELKHIVFSPYWNIPRSIVRNEILPAMERNAGYLARNNMEQTGTSGGLPVIRQKPGPGNALGRVKFLFPNSYAIYFHDTPARSLFERDQRAFSHGCIRLAEPRKLAEYLLQDKPEWNETRITSAMYGNKESWVNLDQPVPVIISYFTAWVDNEGRLHFREDIYGHDRALAKKLFE